MNILWEKTGLIPTEFTFIKGGKVLMIIYTAGKLNCISGLCINEGELLWQKSIIDFLQSKTVGCNSDKDYLLRIFKMKEYIGQKTVSLVAGGYLADNKRITNKPIICNPEIITLDYSGELLSDFPIVINENTPVIFSLFGDENKVQVNSDQGIIRINLYENK